MWRTSSKKARGGIGIHVADEVALRRQLEPLDERTALVDGFLKFQRADHRKFRRDFLDDAERVVRAAVEDDDDLESSGIILAEKYRVVTQHRFDAALLVVSRNQDEQARVGHAH